MPRLTLDELIIADCETLGLLNQSLAAMPRHKRGTDCHLDRVGERQRVLARLDNHRRQQAALLARLP
jgi:hypothetical protein